MKNKTEIEKQLANLWYIINVPYPNEVGMSKIIGDMFRLITQVGTGREYTITKKLKEKFNQYGVDIPNSITHQQLKTFTSKVPFKTMTEHINEIKVIKEFLFNNLNELQEMDETTRLQYLKDYFNNEVKMFHKLKVEEAHLETRKGMTWEDMINEVVDPTRISIKL